MELDKSKFVEDEIPNMYGLLLMDFFNKETEKKYYVLTDDQFKLFAVAERDNAVTYSIVAFGIPWDEVVKNYLS